MLVHETLEFLPGKGPALAAPIEPFIHDACGLPDEHFQRSVIERHTVIAKVATYLGAECAPNHWQPLPIAHGARPGPDTCERRAQTLAARLDLRDSVAIQRTAPIKREPEKIKRRANGAQSLQPFTAYGLQALCLRLTSTVTGTRSRLDNRCGGSPLPVQYFQLLAK